VLALSGACALASVAIDTALPVTLTASLSFCLAAMGLLLPQVMAGALTPFPKSAGAASSVVGFAHQCAGALMSIIVGSTLGATAWPVAWGVAVAGGAALVLWAMTRRLRSDAPLPSAPAE